MLTGEKINLRPIRKEDLQYLNQWKNDRSVYQYLGGGFAPVSLDQQAAWMETMMDLTGQERRFMICTKEGSPIGLVGLYQIHWIHRNCEMGVLIGDSFAQRKGYAKEACQLLERYAADFLNLHKIKIKVVAENQAAYGLWKSLGYQKIGEQVQERFIAGQYQNVILMEKFTVNPIWGGGNFITLIWEWGGSYVCYHP